MVVWPMATRKRRPLRRRSHCLPPPPQRWRQAARSRRRRQCVRRQRGRRPRPKRRRSGHPFATSPRKRTSGGTARGYLETTRRAGCCGLTRGTPPAVRPSSPPPQVPTACLPVGASARRRRRRARRQRCRRSRRTCAPRFRILIGPRGERCIVSERTRQKRVNFFQAPKRHVIPRHPITRHATRIPYGLWASHEIHKAYRGTLATRAVLASLGLLPVAFKSSSCVMRDLRSLRGCARGTRQSRWPHADRSSPRLHAPHGTSPLHS